MKPWGRFILVFFAYGITLLHTVVPHHHFKPAKGEAVIMHTGCVLPDMQNNLLQRVFSTDLGVGHLETFKQNSLELFDLSPAFVAILLTVVFLMGMTPRLPVAAEYAGHIERLRKRLLLYPVVSFRAPPIQ